MSHQFDVVENPDAEDAARRPYLLVLQSDFVSGLRSTIVAPLVFRQAMVGATRLNPIVRVGDQEFWLAAHELFAIEHRQVGKPVANLSDQHPAIIAALDFLFTGF